MTYNDYTDICAAAAITAKARIKLYRLLEHLEGQVSICMLNTDEVIYAAKEPVGVPATFNIKVKSVERAVFSRKKDMFKGKRYLLMGEKTRPFRLVKGMLL